MTGCPPFGCNLCLLSVCAHFRRFYLIHSGAEHNICTEHGLCSVDTLHIPNSNKVLRLGCSVCFNVTHQYATNAICQHVLNSKITQTLGDLQQRWSICGRNLYELRMDLLEWTAAVAVSAAAVLYERAVLHASSAVSHKRVAAIRRSQIGRIAADLHLQKVHKQQTVGTSCTTVIFMSCTTKHTWPTYDQTNTMLCDTSWHRAILLALPFCLQPNTLLVG